ncbi:MAG: hypothetical protein ACR2HG_00875 [Pyrinomonadaceae bacterium]
MSNKNKNNSIIFLTTLSVYLGLVLVGGTPQILAQNAKKSGEANKISILLPGEGLVFTFDLNPAIKLSKLSAKESLPIKVSGNFSTDFSDKFFNTPQKLTAWTITEAVGSPQIVGFLQQEFFPSAESGIPAEPLITKLFPKETSQTVEVSKDTVSITRRLTYDSVEKVAEMAEIHRRIIEHAKSPTAKDEVVGNLYLINTEIRSENNQFIIVTRLPRGSLDALLAKDAQ